MIYPEIRVPIPDMGGYTRRRGSVVYSYVYIGDRQTTTDGGTTHPKSKCYNCTTHYRVQLRIIQSIPYRCPYFYFKNYILFCDSS